MSSTLFTTCYPTVFAPFGNEFIATSTDNLFRFTHNRGCNILQVVFLVKPLELWIVVVEPVIFKTIEVFPVEEFRVSTDIGFPVSEFESLTYKFIARIFLSQFIRYVSVHNLNIQHQNQTSSLRFDQFCSPKTVE